MTDEQLRALIIDYPRDNVSVEASYDNDARFFKREFNLDATKRFLVRMTALFSTEQGFLCAICLNSKEDKKHSELYATQTISASGRVEYQGPYCLPCVRKFVGEEKKRLTL